MLVPACQISQKLMFLGSDPFFLNEKGDLQMQLMPALPSWLFEDSTADNAPTFDTDGNHVVTFKLFGAIPVTYHNKGGKTLYGVPPKSYDVTFANSTVASFDGRAIGSETAHLIRRVSRVASIDAYF
jgi:hypothetical protein